MWLTKFWSIIKENNFEKNSKRSRNKIYLNFKKLFNN